jgi:hypothetical protein
MPIEFKDPVWKAIAKEGRPITRSNYLACAFPGRDLKAKPLDPQETARVDSAMLEVPRTVTSYKSFRLDFFDLAEDEEDGELEDGEVVSKFDQLERMEGRLPAEATFIYGREDEVDNWCTWVIEDYYYILPLYEGKFDWALFRISWDDNYGSFEWEPLGRLRGWHNDWQAARHLLRGVFRKWSLDLRKEENRHYRQLLETL